MAPAATLFVHIFTHREYAYAFEVRDGSSSTGRCRTGNQLTSDAWLQNMDRHRAELMPVLARTYGKPAALRWWVYWREFFMACAELWGYAGGREWLVSHYLFERR